MNDSTNNPRPDEASAGGPATGQILREARLKANIDVNKVCTDLRLSPQVIDALEKGEYHLLPGDPYIRALLGSLGRYLGLDVPSLIQGYNREIGAVHAAPSIAPYKDKAHTYTTAHKQIFVVVFLALFVVLFLLIGKLNKGEPDVSKQGPAANAASAADSLSVPQDTGLESRSLAPDSVHMGKAPADSGEARPVGAVTGKRADTSRSKAAEARANEIRPPNASVAPPGPAPVTPAAKTGTAPAAAAPTVTAAAAAPDTSHQNVAIVKPLIDSVGVKVMRTGKEDFATLLRLGKQMQVSHTDTIVIFVSKRKSVEVILGGKSVIPDRKRFKIYGNTLKTF